MHPLELPEEDKKISPLTVDEILAELAEAHRHLTWEPLRRCRMRNTTSNELSVPRS